LQHSFGSLLLSFSAFHFLKGKEQIGKTMKQTIKPFSLEGFNFAPKI